MCAHTCTCKHAHTTPQKIMIAVPGAGLFGCLEQFTDINSMRPDCRGYPINTRQGSETQPYQQKPQSYRVKNDLQSSAPKLMGK